MEKTELAIIGCGPAGLSAAAEAAQYGIKTTVIDENAKPGGQLFKQIHKFFGSEEHQAATRGFDIGYQLLKRCEKLGVKIILNTAVWDVFNNEQKGEIELALKGDNDVRGRIAAKRVILATGAKENALAFPGWTLPGIMGAGAAQTLVNLHRILPGKKILIVGSGNVGLIVAYQLAQGGARVEAVIDLLPVISGWAVHAGKVRRQGIPILTGCTVLQALGKNMVEKVIIGLVGPDSRIISGTEKTKIVDTVCLAVGLTPLAELAWAIDCQFVYNQDLGGHLPLHNERMETTVSGVYVAGDMCGIEEASTAMEEGKIAGLSVAESLGYLSPDKANHEMKTIEKSLANLRGGEMGKARRLAKNDIVRRWHCYWKNTKQRGSYPAKN